MPGFLFGPLPALDHLVVAAASLDEGVRWCEQTLGLTPGPGGKHPLFGTHNRLLRLDADPDAAAYLEIIAIDSGAARGRPAGLKRWFDLDDAALSARLVKQGPQLLHWVARVGDVQAARAALWAQGIDRGDVLAASRETPQGLLQWQITVRPDGQRLFDGCLPTLIEWGAVHPTQHMPASGLRLQGLALSHPQDSTLRQALQALGLSVPVQPGPAGLAVQLQTPLGMVRLSSCSA